MSTVTENKEKGRTMKTENKKYMVYQTVEHGVHYFDFYTADDNLVGVVHAVNDNSRYIATVGVNDFNFTAQNCSELIEKATEFFSSKKVKE